MAHVLKLRYPAWFVCTYYITGCTYYIIGAVAYSLCQVAAGKAHMTKLYAMCRLEDIVSFTATTKSARCKRRPAYKVAPSQ